MIKKVHIPQWKLDEVDHLVELFKKNKVVVVIEVANINDKQIQDVRKKLRGKATVRMSKKSLQIRAIEKFKKESKKPNLDELTKNIAAQTSFAFTNMDPFELKRQVDGPRQTGRSYARRHLGSRRRYGITNGTSYF